jgi:hypothetical protein
VRGDRTDPADALNDFSVSNGQAIVENWFVVRYAIPQVPDSIETIRRLCSFHSGRERAM